jgi:hypothetical protein
MTLQVKSYAATVLALSYSTSQKMMSQVKPYAATVVLSHCTKQKCKLLLRWQV